MANLLGRSIVRTVSMRPNQSEEFGVFLAHDELREAQGEMIVDGIAALGSGGVQEVFCSLQHLRA